MILFFKDWKKYPTAIPDISTKNESFIKYSKLLKHMGVKNHAFPLALHNPMLKGVDPHSTKLTNEQIAMIIKEAKSNPWYIFRELIKLPADASPEPMTFLASRGNISTYWLFFNHITSLLIQPRQTGKSVGTDSLMVSIINILSTYTKVHLLTKDDQLRGENVKRIKAIMDELPWYLRLRTKKDANNTEKITVNRLNNTYLTSVPQSSVKAAKNLGRGLTVAIHHIDEIAFIKNLEHTLGALLASSTAARDNAKRAGAPYGNIFTTTAGYLNTPEGAYAKAEIYDKSLRWTEKLYDCEDEDNLRETISKNTPDGEVQVLLEFNHRQLGKTDEWLAEKISNAKSKGENAEADFLNKWANGGSSAAISKEDMAKLVASRVNDPFTEVSNYGYITRWYIPRHEVLSGEIKKRKLVMGLDPSEAMGNDDLSMVIRDVVTGETVAAGNYNETNTMLFSKWLLEWIIEYPNMTVAIEKRSSGAAMVDHLLLMLPIKGIDPFKRLFNWVVDEAHVNPEYYKILNTPLDKRPSNIYDKYKKQFGFTTSASGRASRDKLYGGAFTASIAYTSDTARDGTLITQLTTLVKRNNRIDHAEGGHDDSVIAWLLAYWFLANAKNKHYYNIDSNRVLLTVTAAIVKEQGGVEEIYRRQKIVETKKQISDILAMAEKETLEYKKLEHIRRAMKLNAGLGEETMELNIDSLIKEAGRDKPKDFEKPNIIVPFRAA